MEHEPIIASSSNQYLPKDIVCGVPSGINRSGENNSLLNFEFTGSGMIKKKKILLQVGFVNKRNSNFPSTTACCPT